MCHQRPLGTSCARQATAGPVLLIFQPHVLSRREMAVGPGPALALPDMPLLPFQRNGLVPGQLAAENPLMDAFLLPDLAVANSAGVRRNDPDGSHKYHT